MSPKVRDILHFPMHYNKVERKHTYTVARNHRVDLGKHVKSPKPLTPASQTKSNTSKTLSNLQSGEQTHTNRLVYAIAAHVL